MRAESVRLPLSVPLVNKKKKRKKDYYGESKERGGREGMEEK